MLFADLVSFLLHKRREALDVAGHRLASFFLGLGERLVKFFYLIVFGAGIRALDGQRTITYAGPVAVEVAVAAAAEA